ncbi:MULTISPECIES: ABC transporter ATP-binding protein [unclassified Neorhizobium]|uniref:ABC transporter ATP-binding protein n=1 Tax=unclassified Neorhizobium TaxID=2629175 RepID=UPI001FF22BE4|nr:MULTISPECIES: ABC transporter ATP-binding protein [unclassified Neorhizobium]MCJ9672253.1 ABC transporter ATP-binding protein [Neorhizobium sp. SHOUNA12B]MCJ9748097.1 ABC transporter ATP-binding protein [Neorhizobium sp. SHOUNA12A]
MPTINLNGAQKNYGVNSANAVSDLDLEIGDGEFMCLLGPSGCGKTTTLRMIAGLENLSGGEIRIGEKVVDSVQEGVFVPPEKREMGLVFQSYALWPHMTIERNTDFGLRLRKLPKAEREARVEQVMQALDIAKYRDRYPSQLSGGQQQRVALARMLAVNPGVLLLDEPLSNLDARLRLEMRAELKRIHKEFKTTIVFVTHDQWEAMTLATTIAVMNNGTLQQMGTPNEIYDRPANRFVAEFVGSPPINILDLDTADMTNVAREAAVFLSARQPSLKGIGAIGLRPEAIGYTDDKVQIPSDSFSGEMIVTGVLPTGGSWILELRSDNNTLFLTTSVLPRVELGTKTHFYAETGALHVFDKAGRRIAEADSLLRDAAIN